MLSFLSFTVFINQILIGLAHPTVYPQHLILDKQGPPIILSWHVHIVYSANNKVSQNASYALRDNARFAFIDILGNDCFGRYDEKSTCMIKPEDEPFGPFPVAEWSIFVLPKDFQSIVPWMTQNRGDLDMLIHPNTGFEYEDHENWALWSGQKWPLNLNIFKKGKKTNECDKGTKTHCDDPQDDDDWKNKFMDYKQIILH